MRVLDVMDTSYRWVDPFPSEPDVQLEMRFPTEEERTKGDSIKDDARRERYIWELMADCLKSWRGVGKFFKQDSDPEPTQENKLRFFKMRVFMEDLEGDEKVRLMSAVAMNRLSTLASVTVKN